MHQPRRLHGGAVREIDTPPEDGRTNSLRDSACVERHRLLRRTDLGGSSNGVVDGVVLRRSCRDHQHAGLAQPDVLSARLAERAHCRHDSLPGACELQRTLRSEQGKQISNASPVTVQKAAVATARPRTAGLGLDEHDVQ